MKKHIHGLFILILGAMLSSCAHNHPSIVGVWHCDAAGGSGVCVWNVKPDHITIEFQNERAECTYTIDRSRTPHWLDITRADEVHKCIIEFVDVDTIRMTGLGEDDVRPSGFTADTETLTFKRKQ